MPIVMSGSGESDTTQAVREVVADVQRKLGGAPPDLAFVFVSRHHAPRLEEAVALLQGELEARHLLGCSAESVIGGSVEYEARSGLVLWAASLPGAKIQAFHVSHEGAPDGDVFLGMPEIPPGPAGMVLLPEPYSFPAGDFISRLSRDHPELQVLGGMASGALSPGENRLFLGSEVLIDGAVAVVVSGAVRVRPLVSQGCRPFGKHLVVTRAEQNQIHELGGQPAIEKLREQLKELTTEEQALLARGLHLGIATDARKRRHGRGDFLVRSVMGIHKETGAIVVTDIVRPGATVQFHLRDAETASEDLQLLLREARASGLVPLGGLLFSCNGRGRRMFDVPDHDAATVTRELGEIPLAGFFAAGEIGPVGRQNFLHGFTASLALFEEAR